MRQKLLIQSALVVAFFLIAWRVSRSQTLASGEVNQLPQLSSCSHEPEAEGAYYCSPQGWVKLEHLMSRGEKETHLYRLFLSFSALVPEKALIFPGARAPVQIREKRPIFLVRQGPSASSGSEGSFRDVIVARLDQNKNERDLQITSGNIAFTFKKRIGKERTPDIIVKPQSPRSYTVTPKADLDVGEYMLTFDTAQTGGYDFGIE